MVDAAAPQDGKSESMEEILQSIKRIMDDNTEAEPKPAAETATAPAEDVFELTEPVKEEKSAELTPIPSAPAPVAANTEATIKSVEAVFSAAEPKSPAVDMDTLMSEQSVSAAASSFRKISDATRKDYSIPSIPSPQLRNGNTVEDLVLEALRPMLKDWLDKNLPVIVQKIVEKEIKRIVTMHID